VTAYSDHCISLLHTIRGDIKRYYNDRVELIRIAWNESSGTKRLKHTAAMIDLNEQFADVMRTLKELEHVYSVLPVAHDNLATAIYHPKFSAEGIQRLRSSAKRLQSLYNELKETEEKE
jgi:tRNA (Thr-GGU) A37 N-methylase